MADKTPTLKSMNYDASPPRCFNCKHRFTAKVVVKSKTTRTMMCALAQQPVRTSSVCDSWLGYKGETLEPTAPGVKSTALSEFIRNATPEEKSKVYGEVMDKVAAQQQTVIDGVALPDGAKNG